MVLFIRIVQLSLTILKIIFYLKYLIDLRLIKSLPFIAKLNPKFYKQNQIQLKTSVRSSHLGYVECNKF